jgi:modulator of FtsH protease
MPGNGLEGWANFFIAAAGVSATLAGLVIVAVSVNIQLILKHPQLPPRASATITALMVVVVAGLAALMPQPQKAFAGEILAFGAVGWVIQLVCSREIVREHLRDGRPVMELVVGLPGGHLAALSFMVGAVLLWTAHDGALLWIAAGVFVTLVFAVLNAWVFLIEVLR